MSDSELPVHRGQYILNHQRNERYFPSVTETNLSAFIWSVADLLRGDYKQSDYGKFILPFTVR
jgi:type I restriction-modification system DNA methylase subunit